MKKFGIAAYGAPAFATYFLLNPTWSILPGVYAKYRGLDLATLAAAILVSRMFDAVCDPVIGLLSDKHRAAGGSRKTWVLFGGIGFAVAAYFLYIPPAKVSGSYFFLSLCAFLFCWTLVEIPQLAWGREIATSSRDRALVFGWRVSFIFCGFSLFFLVPFLPFAHSREYTPELLKVAYGVGATAMLIALVLNYCVAPEGERAPERHNDSLRQLWKSVVNNPPLKRFAALYLVMNTAFSMWFGLMFIFLSAYLGYGEQITLIFLIASVCGFGSIPLWVGTIKHIGVSAALTVGLMLFAVSLAVSALMTPGCAWGWVLALIAVGFITLALKDVAIPTLLAGVVDYGKAQFGVDRGATYFALSALISKATYAIGVALALWIVKLFSLDPAASVQSAHAVVGLRIAYAGIPIGLMLISVYLLRRFLSLR